jgi:transposase InsO family protein
MFQITGIPVGMTIASDNGSNFRAALTKELMARLGVSPVFSTPYHPVSIVERSIQTLKNTIAKMVYDHNDSWVNYLGPSLWAIRSTINESVGCPPHLLVFGHMPRGPLSILSETWSGNVESSPTLSKSTVEYLGELKSKLEIAQQYASDCVQREQQRHVDHYNLKAKEQRTRVSRPVTRVLYYNQRVRHRMP